MTLNAIWQIIRRRWLFILIPTLLGILLTVTFNFSSAGKQQIQFFNERKVHFLVGQAPGQLASESEYERYHAWVQSEYISGSLADWVNGTDFAGRVSTILADEFDIAISPERVLPYFFAERIRSQVIIEIVHEDDAMIESISQAAVKIMTGDLEGILPPLGDEVPLVVLIDYPEIVPADEVPVANQLATPLRIAVAFAIGLCLAFLMEYIDPKVHSRNEFETIGYSILAEIPKG